MNEKIVMLDFAGTLVKAEIIEEGNEFRAKILKRAFPTKKEHSDPESFYKANREFVEKLTGLSKDAQVRYRKNDLRFMDLSGEDVQNQISTNLFQIGMYMAAKKHGKNIAPEGLIEQLQRIKGLGYKLAIVSGVRTDIISGMLQIAKLGVEFDYIYGQPPKLGVENQEQDVKELKAQGEIAYSLGDKMSDLERGNLEKDKLIYVTWGHASGGEEGFVDYVVNKPAELSKIIQ